MVNDNNGTSEIEKLNILSQRHLGHLLGVAPEKLAEIARYADTYYAPFDTTGRERPFQKHPNKSRTIDNPRGDMKKVQRRIYRRLLRPICFPEHILGGVRKRSVLDNGDRHLGSNVLVTVDIRKCFPSINNVQIYRVWRETLGCTPPVASLLTRLTTYKRRLPQGSPASPLLANLFIWSIDKPIREACKQKSVVYSTWIDDLGFSGILAREVIQVAAKVLAAHGLRLSRKKIRVMGSREKKLLTGTRLGQSSIRASREKLARVRSGIHKLRKGLVPASKQERYVDGLVGQLLYIERLCPIDSDRYVRDLAECNPKSLSSMAKKFLNARLTQY
ncbi:MAG TPA: reverse transcriptase family protein [Candidatus Angelobacter sp.]|nr:reverse transcriptase family protein [Candidatus Angelobacter sp.]